MRSDNDSQQDFQDDDRSAPDNPHLGQQGRRDGCGEEDEYRVIAERHAAIFSKSIWAYGL